MLSLFTGLCWMADSMEMTILSILSPALQCEWDIDKYKQAFLTTVRNNNVSYELEPITNESFLIRKMLYCIFFPVRIFWNDGEFAVLG